MKKNNTDVLPLHPFGDLTTVGGRLTVGGCFAEDLAKKYGTPLYVFDVSRAQKTAKAYVDILKREYGKATVCYASKAFCCTAVYSFLAPLGLGADVVSGGELFTALKGGLDAKKIYFHGNNKTEAEIIYALKSGIGYFVVDSESELKIINKYAQNTQNVLIRVNPGVEAHTHKYIQTATSDSKFGFAIADGTATDVILSLKNYKNINFCGLSCHIGSQIFEKQAFETAIEVMCDYIASLEKAGIKVEKLDLGGGFGIHYTQNDKPLTPEEYMTATAKYMLAAVSARGITKPELVVEPGRSIVGEAGITLYTVGAIKTIKGVKTYASVDGGMFENPRVALYGAEYTAVVADRAAQKGDRLYTVAGKCCESGDILIDGIILPELKEGDILAVLSTGAYHYSMASNYNRNAVPPVVAVKDGKSDYMIKPQTYEDIVRNDNIPYFSESVK